MNDTPEERLADDLILFLRQSPEKSHSLDSLAQNFNVSPADIKAAIELAESWGYQFFYSENAIRFQHSPDLLTATEISYQLATDFIGKTIHAYRKVKSTNEIALRQAESGAVDGVIVTAEEQTEGRGRLGRQWHSPSGKGVYLSIILRPLFPPDKAPGISLMTALALADTISDYCPGKVKIKWPNDVLIEGKKTAGILTELSAEKATINHLVVGVGININHELNDFPPDLRHKVTSVALAVGKPVKRISLVQRFLVNFEVLYKQYSISGLNTMLDRLRHYSSLINHQVTLVSGKQTITGTVRDIAPTGSLLLEREGKIIFVTSGEVTVVSF